MINNKKSSSIEDITNVMKMVELIQSDSCDFKRNELSMRFLKEFMDKTKLLKALKNYIEILPESLRDLIYKRGLNEFINSFYDSLILGVPVMILRLEILSSGVIERSRLDFETSVVFDQLEEVINDYIEYSLQNADISTEHISVNPFEFYRFIYGHISKFNVKSDYIYDSDSVKVFLDIFGQKMIPSSLYNRLSNKESTTRNSILDDEARIYYYFNYESESVVFVKNTLDVDDIKFIIDDEHINGCYASYSYIYSKAIDSFIKKSSKDNVSKLLSYIENLYKYKSVDRTTYSEPIIVKKGDLLFDRFNCSEDIENYIVMGEFYWAYDQGFDYSDTESLMHTKYYLEEINKMLEGY